MFIWNDVDVVSESDDSVRWSDVCLWSRHIRLICSPSLIIGWITADIKLQIETFIDFTHHNRPQNDVTIMRSSHAVIQSFLSLLAFLYFFISFSYFCTPIFYIVCLYCKYEVLCDIYSGQSYCNEFILFEEIYILYGSINALLFRPTEILCVCHFSSAAL